MLMPYNDRARLAMRAAGFRRASVVLPNVVLITPDDDLGTPDLVRFAFACDASHIVVLPDGIDWLRELVEAKC